MTNHEAIVILQKYLNERLDTFSVLGRHFGNPSAYSYMKPEQKDLRHAILLAIKALKKDGERND